MTTPNGAYFRNRLPRFFDCPDPERFESVQFGPDSGDHIFLLWPDEIAALARKAGLTLERFDLFTSPLTAGHVKLAALLRVLPERLVFGLESLFQRLPSRLLAKCAVHSAARLRKPGGAEGPESSRKPAG
jgi:2-polyprenyl-6-hydroxyphenyl methylase/3-demethylubiquinone-9 3-methyltransferase